MSDEWDQPEEDDEVEQLETFFGNVYEFVDEWIIPRCKRKPGAVRWDPDWFTNIEAVDRLEALWRASEFYRLEGMTGMAVFWNDQFDPHDARAHTPREYLLVRHRVRGRRGKRTPAEMKSTRPPAALRSN